MASNSNGIPKAMDKHPFEEDSISAGALRRQSMENSDNQWWSKVSLMEDAENCLGQSLLIFLFADLRLMSATGRLHTKFETLSIDCDDIKKNEASVFAGTNDEKDFHRETHVQSMGFYPAQVMALLLTELRREVLVQRRNEELAMEKKGKKGSVNSFTTTDDSDDESDNGIEGDHPSILSSLANKEDRKFNEKEMPNLLKAYNQMIADDLADKPPQIRRVDLNNVGASTKNLFKSVIKKFNASHVKDHDSVVDSMQQSDQFQPTPQSFEMPCHTDLTPMNSKHATSFKLSRRNPDEGDTLHRHSSFNFEKRNIIAKIDPNNKEQVSNEIGDVGDFLFRGGTAAGALGKAEDSYYTEEEILSMMEKAVESRLHSRMDFMSSFFKEGSVSYVLAKSKAKIVWINDWFPLRELTYAISVDFEKKTIMVMFRGCITISDWAHAIDYKQAKIPNPVTDDYNKKKKNIKIHRGFYQYLFMKRKDTGTTKFDEIANRVHGYGIREIGDDYKVLVTGHSLGGTLSTVFGFFASFDKRLTKNSHIKIISFGSPYVGNRSFADAFRYQEKTFKLQYARFKNQRDLFPHIPANFIPTKRGAAYQHVGVGIKLPYPTRFRCWSQTDQLLSYIHEEDDRYWLQSYGRAFKNNFVFHLALPWRFPINHSLFEHQKRIMYWKRLRDVEDDPLLSKPLNEIYKKVVFKNQFYDI